MNNDQFLANATLAYLITTKTLYHNIKRYNYENNKQPRILKNLRRKVSQYIKRKNNNLNYIESISCTIKELKNHIENQFQCGMSWDNYGPGYRVDENGRPIYNICGEIIKLKQWQIDHILPVSKFDLANPEAIKHINHYKNLRPMWSNENNLKSNKILKELINEPEIQRIYKEYITL